MTESMNKPSLTFLEHCDELRKRLMVSVIAFAVCAVASFFFADQILDVLMRPIRPLVETFYFFTPAEAFLVKIKCALIAGFISASPVMIAQIWLFISPAMRREEKLAIIPLTLVATALFLTGVVFAFFSCLPLALQFLVGNQTAFLKPMISLSEYLNFEFGLLVAFGVAFNLPVFIITLALFGLINSKVLWHYQRHAIVFIFIAAAVVTPGPDIASQFLLAIPMLFLYEISFAGTKLIELFRKRA